MTNEARCIHGRYRIDPCIGCGRRYISGELVGAFLHDADRLRNPECDTCTYAWCCGYCSCCSALDRRIAEERAEQFDRNRERLARERGEQVTACRYCHQLIADPLHWMHEESHARDADR